MKEQIEEMRAEAHEITNRVQQDRQLSAEAKAILYSNWYYLAIWSLTAIPGFQNLNSITERLHLDKRKAQEALEFLKEYKLVIENKDGSPTNGPTMVHLESTSPQLGRHHQNWRLQAFRHYEKPVSTNAHYTAPVTLSERDAKAIRENILKFISSSVDTIKDSPSEKLYCLCIDWFEV